MASRADLKTYFETGDTPTQAQFQALIDSILNLTDDDYTDVPGLVAALDGLTGPQGPAGPAGATGPAGPAGADGADGTDGQGVPIGGAANEYLMKSSSTDYDTEWKATKPIFLDATDDASIITAIGSATFTDNVATVTGFEQGRKYSDANYLYEAITADTALRIKKAETESTITVSTSDPSGGADGDIWFKVSA